MPHFFLALVSATLVAFGVANPSLDTSGPPQQPVVLRLEAESAETAHLEWQAVPGAVFRLCLTHDRAREQPWACFIVGAGTETSVGVPEHDGDLFMLSLQACFIEAMTNLSCSTPADAGMIARRQSGPFDFYATALPTTDHQAQLSAYSLVEGSALAYHQAAPGRADQRKLQCDAPVESVCGAAELKLPGALAGVTQDLPGAGSASLVFQVYERPHAALLFDDGTGLFTGGRLTAQVILDDYGVKGNFFIIGRIMRDNPGAIRALVAAGHRVGNHTYTHPFLTRMTDAQVAQELDQTEQQYRAIVPGGTTKPCFRAPNGAIDRRVDAIVRARGFQQIDWNVGSLDWTKNSPDQIVRNVLLDLKDGALISFHTQEPSTMVALRTLVPLMQSWGYQFDLVC